MIISILAVGIFVRFFHLGVIPPGLNQDEASIGYDAWALLRYGIDRNGFHNPIHLVSWGSGQNALYAYLSMPFIALFGLNTFSVRILNAAMGCLSLPIFYYLIQGVTDRKTGIIALFLLAISPWHIMMSRWGLESNIFPAFLLIGTWLVFLSLKRNSFLPLAMFVFALSLYAYGTAYFFVPLFLLGILLYLLRHGKIRSITLLISIGVFVLTALPILLFLLVNIYQLDSMQLLGFSIPRLPSTPRFSTISSLLSHRFFTDSFANFLDLLDLLFGTQSDGLIWNSIHPYGYMFHFSTPFLIFGLVRSLKREYWYRFHPALLIPIWFLAAIALGTVVSVNVNRVNAVFLPAIALIAFGMSHLYEHAKTFFKSLILVYAVFFMFFLHSYFGVYPQYAGPAFFESLGEAIQYALAQAPPHVPIYATDKVNMPYIFVLFYGKISPHTFLNSVTYTNPNAPFRQVASFDRYHFEIQDKSLQESGIYIFHNASEEGFFRKDPRFMIRRFLYYSVAVQGNR